MNAQQEATSEAIRNMAGLFEPWRKAMQPWLAEGEKLQKAAADSVTRFFEAGYAATKEGLAAMANIGTTMQKHAAAQVERTMNFWTAFLS